MDRGTDIAVHVALDQLDRAACDGDAAAVVQVLLRLSAVLESGAPSLGLMQKAQQGVATALARLELRRAANPARAGYGRGV